VVRVFGRVIVIDIGVLWAQRGRTNTGACLHSYDVPLIAEVLNQVELEGGLELSVLYDKHGMSL
jgi:hypothetical protein